MAHLIHHRVVSDDLQTVEAVEDRPALTETLGELLVLAAAAVMLVSGVLTVVRAGLGPNLASPVVSVFGYTHTAWLGLAEAGAGVLLLIAGMSAATRGLAIVVGVLLVVGAVIIRADVTAVPHQLAVEHSYGWFVLADGVVATIGGLAPGGWTRRRIYRREVPTVER